MIKKEEAMANKEIIIDGVDVSKCKHYGDNIFYTCNETCTKDGGITCTICEDNPNCNFKQLQRTTSQYNAVVEQNKNLQSELKQKEQECEELKGEITLGGGKLSDKIRANVFTELQYENNRYKQALDEIESYTRKQFCENCDVNGFPPNCEYCEYYEYVDIINKAKEVNNEKNI